MITTNCFTIQNLKSKIQNGITNRESPHPGFANAKPPLPARGEGIEGWGKTAVGEAFKLKLTPMVKVTTLLPTPAPKLLNSATFNVFYLLPDKVRQLSGHSIILDRGRR